ncbi:response regulator [Paenibacillus lactis]|uniref:Two component transcriptional regulator, AraC family n=2 Tax=Paenibacillus lactis TaxID=228574 RepID=G4HGI1_9BACL|nr:response regulator [Paenibacillus lactis]EHB63854.1 two component transcriptional regulator, AraC family [Paenibacillus lactis 154]MBP1894874.1 two-component system response regulator YesN [Paenibacillus lactis]HAF96889.1 DNA-binding response regulator [Paenibacillus lactis]
MKVLIADDDVYTREGLVESIDWEDYGVSEVLQVEDGAEALRKATIHRPEIVITDIRMPKLNGIEFAERLVAACPDSKVLFISGYMDVAYLKSAIRLAAVDYVEKPIKLPEMEEAIRKTIRFIQQERERHVLLDQKLELERTKLANVLRTQSLGGDEIRRICDAARFPADVSYVCLVVSRWDQEGQGWAITSPNDNDWGTYAPAVLTEQLDQNRQLMIVPLCSPNERGAVLHAAERLCGSGREIRIGVGSVVSHLDEVPRSFHESELALELIFFRHRTSIIVYDKSSWIPYMIKGDIYLEFYHYLKQSPNELTGWMESFCDRLMNGGYMPRTRVMSWILSFAHAMLSERGGVLLTTGKVYQFQEIENHLNACRSMQEVKQFILSICHAYQKEAEEVSPYSHVVRTVLCYISRHCSNADLDIREIADHVHLSAAHLGMLFKQETGTTMKQYLNDYRLELAKRLVAGEHFKMADIARMCGYASPGYFTKVFKTSTGLTPVEYRKKRCG